MEPVLSTVPARGDTGARKEVAVNSVYLQSTRKCCTSVHPYCWSLVQALWEFPKIRGPISSTNSESPIIRTPTRGTPMYRSSHMRDLSGLQLCAKQLPRTPGCAKQPGEPQIWTQRPGRICQTVHPPKGSYSLASRLWDPEPAGRGSAFGSSQESGEIRWLEGVREGFSI